jgi:hypothetical protein
MSSAPRPPSGDSWLQEIKHDGFLTALRTWQNRPDLSRPNGKKPMEWVIALVVLFFVALPFLFWWIGYCDKIGIEEARSHQ